MSIMATFGTMLNRMESEMNNVLKESKIRTIAKTITWRVWGTLDTFIFSWLFINEVKSASGIALIDTIVKLLLYYFHERLWQNVPLGYFRNLFGKNKNTVPNYKKESHIRSFTKSLSWRIVGSLTTVLIAYIWLGDKKVAWSLGGIEFVSKLILYYFHERLWQLIPRGQFRKLWRSEK